MRERPVIKSINMDTYGEDIVYQEKNESTAREVRTVSNLRKMFSFNSERHWINKAKSLFASCEVPRSRYICLDTEGRVCVSGAEFMRATKEGTYPITVIEI